MELILYYMLMGYFSVGAIAIWRINKNKPSHDQKARWLKFGTYFVIINALFFSIYFGPQFFHYLVILIIFAGIIELVKVKWQSNQKGKTMVFFFSVLAYLIVSAGLYYFSLMEKPVLFFGFFVIMVFDAFSQLSGQLFGRKKLIPSVSPNKTVAGLIGGFIFATLTATFMGPLIGSTLAIALISGLIVATFALAGDLLASIYKRQFNVKDFSRILPGHGGFLDRFDSLIMGGAGMYLLNSLSL